MHQVKAARRCCTVPVAKGMMRQRMWECACVGGGMVLVLVVCVLGVHTPARVISTRLKITALSAADISTVVCLPRRCGHEPGFLASVRRQPCNP